VAREPAFFALRFDRKLAQKPSENFWLTFPFAGDWHVSPSATALDFRQRGHSCEATLGKKKTKKQLNRQPRLEPFGMPCQRRVVPTAAQLALLLHLVTAKMTECCILLVLPLFAGGWSSSKAEGNLKKQTSAGRCVTDRFATKDNQK
jgi:hypothetical protein